MGKGVFLSINNALATPIKIDYSNLDCVHANGSEGSDFRPITGTLQPGQRFSSQYIEAKASGSCAFSKSTFRMNIHGDFGSMAIEFVESSRAWKATCNEVTCGKAQATVIVVPGSQYTINVSVQHKASWSPRSWMRDLTFILGDRPINQIAIPGTHDSATHAIEVLSRIAPSQDIPEWLNYALLLSPGGELAAGAIIAGWAKAQHLTILEQLMQGIRYLDLRVARWQKEYIICHGKYSCPFDDVVADLKRFADANPGEVVIVDINHIYECNSDAEHQGLTAKLFDALGDKMAPNTLNATTPLATFQNSGYQFITLYDNQDVVSSQTLNKGRRLWSQRQISSPWPDKQSLEDLLPAMKANLDKRSSTQLFVLQGVVSPKGTTIAKGLVPFTSDPGSLQSLADQVTPAVCNSIGDWKPRCIVIVDWFDCLGTTYVTTVVNLNLGLDYADASANAPARP